MIFCILAHDPPVAVPGGSSVPAALRPVSLLQHQASPRGTSFPSLPGLCVADPSPVPVLLWVQWELPAAALRARLRFSVWDLFRELHSWEVKQDICSLRQIRFIITYFVVYFLSCRINLKCSPVLSHSVILTFPGFYPKSCLQEHISALAWLGLKEASLD